MGIPSALMYNAFNCTLDQQRGQHDKWNSLIAGGLTGALFRRPGAQHIDSLEYSPIYDFGFEHHMAYQ
jgi:hypothetical protein